jgi:hypothetical protein
VLLGEDIDSFYPSVTLAKVRAVFQHVFRFPPDVAVLLARLCTRAGALPQGAVTSTDIANLVLYRTEPELNALAEKRGFRYSRFIDDMHASSDRHHPSAEIGALLGDMRGVLEREGFTPKRRKQFVATAGRRMRVHGLNVNSKASAPRVVRQKLKNEVFLLERWAEMQPWNSEIDRCFVRLASRVGQLKQTNPGESRRLKGRLHRLSEDRRAYLGTRLSGVVTTSRVTVD